MASVPAATGAAVAHRTALVEVGAESGVIATALTCGATLAQVPHDTGPREPNAQPQSVFKGILLA